MCRALPAESGGRISKQRQHTRQLPHLVAPREPHQARAGLLSLYKGLALAGSGTPDAVEGACGILNRISEEPDQDPTPVL